MQLFPRIEPGPSAVPDARRLERFRLAQEERYATLPEAFHTLMPAEGFPRWPVMLHANPDVARQIGLDPALLADPLAAEIFSGRVAMPGFAPLAMVYAGHQFGSWAGQLGDGRALLIGQARGPDGVLRDIQLKGAGRTPYSRFGDGRAVMRSSIREYLCGEAMAGLGIPTSRGLCLVATREPVRRESIEPGAILTRVAESHVRFGHFEFFHHIGPREGVKMLADHVIDAYLPEVAARADRYEAFFATVVERTARLMADWQAVGFAHGVMNTDNMSILGLTLDYGPYGFVEAFDPGFVCNHSDETGRYAFDRQPSIALWNLQALAASLVSILPGAAAVPELKRFQPLFQEAFLARMRAKLGLVGEDPGDVALAGDLLLLMEAAKADLTLTFRGLSDAPTSPAAWRLRFPGHEADADAWLARWRARLGEEPAERVAARLDAVNPAYVLRNWVAEAVIRAVEDAGDTSLLDAAMRMARAPFDDHPELAAFAAPAPERYRDLCVSCSS
jgi:hypothetical protein